MKESILNSFLTNYIMSLFERSRIEKQAEKYGFDVIIYHLALTKNWIPVRLPFFRQAATMPGRTKTEAEMGIDLSFLSQNELIIFVLKDEALTNKNWTKHNFDSDIRMAAFPDLSSKELQSVKKVKIILAYNKDEDQTGIHLYNNLIQGLGTKRKDKVVLSFERWNLTRIVEEVKNNLLSPQLMPQHLSGLLNYICSQIADFDYGTMEWENQLIPNWKNFLRTALKKPIDERKLRLIPIALVILHHYKKQTPNAYPGWIDLIEWAILAVWESYRTLTQVKLKKIIIAIWLHFYVSILEQYFIENEPAIISEHGLHKNINAVGLVPIVDAHIAFWHLGRLGILTLAPQEFFDANNENQQSTARNLINRSAGWVIRCLHANPASLRPLIDLHHIELFLTWLILWQSGRNKDIYEWLSELESRLVVRRFGKANLPFIEGRNRMDLVAEYAATSEKPPEFTDNSSYLLLMLLELCFSLEDSSRDELLNRFYKRVIRGIGDDGKPLSENRSEVDLIGWSPPDNWEQQILHEKVIDGIAITTSNFVRFGTADKPLSAKIKEFVDISREKFPFKGEGRDIPRTAYVLACLKNRSPLPSEFWRGTIFPIKEEAGSNIH